MDCESIFNPKKTHALHYSHPLFGICHNCHFHLLLLPNLHRGVEWVGRFLKNFQNGGRGDHLKCR